MPGDLAYQFPDVEIYIKDSPLEDILLWLQCIFDEVMPDAKATQGSRLQTLSLTYNEKTIPCVIYPDAVKGKFTSLWFKSGDTPWQTDRDCALAAFDYLHTEIRCSSSSWTTEDDDEVNDRWLRLNHEGESIVRWKV